MRIPGLSAVALTLAACAAALADGPRIVVVDTPQADRFAEAMGKFRQALSAQVPGASFDSKRIAAKEDLPKVIAAIQAEKPALVVAVSSGVCDALRKEIKDVPILFTMAGVADVEALEAERKANSPNLAGVTILIPPADQFRIMAQAIPGLKRVGVIYTPKKSGKMIEAARRETAKVGIDLVAQPVEELSQVSDALEKVLPSCDAYWLIPDPNSCQNSALESALTRGITLRKPMVGCDVAHARAGWYLGIYCDLGDVAEQTARLAAEILGGKAPSSIPIETPRNPRYALNLGTGTALGINVPVSARDGAAEVIGQQ
ncbi:MAG: ABC transporter substrate binding protein [Planctomycetota bacterium]